MIAPLELYLWLLCFTVPIFWLAVRFAPVLRRPILIAVSAVVLFAISPVILVGLALYFGAIQLGWLCLQRGWISVGALKRGTWLAFAPLLLAEWVPGRLAAGHMFGSDLASSSNVSTMAYLALGFTAIRAFLVVRQSIASGRLDSASALAALTFFGSFSAGPIAGSDAFDLSRSAPRLDLAVAIRAVCRIGWGAALVLVVAPMVREFAPADAVGAGAAWTHVYLTFLAVYLDFAGYSDVAIGTAALFGVRLPENFDMPLLSRSVQEFWRRWHLSLSGFIGTYLYKPLVRANGRPALSILIAFILAGLWHRLSAPYLLWGIGHGGALALHLLLRRRPLPMWRNLPPAVRGGTGWLSTMTYVALLSAIANQPSLGDVGRLVSALVSG